MFNTDLIESIVKVNYNKLTTDELNKIAECIRKKTKKLC